MFLPVDSIAFVRLQRSHAQFSLPLFVPFFDQTLEPAKTKRRPRGRFHSNAQVNARARKHQNTYP